MHPGDRVRGGVRVTRRAGEDSQPGPTGSACTPSGPRRDAKSINENWRGESSQASDNGLWFGVRGRWLPWAAGCADQRRMWSRGGATQGRRTDGFHASAGPQVQRVFDPEDRHRGQSWRLETSGGRKREAAFCTDCLVLMDRKTTCGGRWFWPPLRRI